MRFQRQATRINMNITKDKEELRFVILLSAPSNYFLLVRQVIWQRLPRYMLLRGRLMLSDRGWHARGRRHQALLYEIPLHLRVHKLVCEVHEGRFECSNNHWVKGEASAAKRENLVEHDSITFPAFALETFPLAWRQGSMRHGYPRWRLRRSSPT